MINYKDNETVTNEELKEIRQFFKENEKWQPMARMYMLNLAVLHHHYSAIFKLTPQKLVEETERFLANNGAKYATQISIDTFDDLVYDNYLWQSYDGTVHTASNHISKKHRTRWHDRNITIQQQLFNADNPEKTI